MSSGDTVVLLRNGHVHTPAAREATAMLVAGDTVAWVGSEEAAAGLADGAGSVVDLGGRLVTPAFVDGHVHVLETGLHLSGIDLSRAATVSEVLDLVRRAAADGRDPVHGHGWDDTRGPRAVTAAELEDAAPGRRVYLSRVDVHSAVVSTALAQRAGCHHLPGWDPVGLVTGEAHHAARRDVRRLSVPERARAHRAALGAAAAAGIADVHEMAGPDLAGADDLDPLLVAAGEAGVGVRWFWAGTALPDGLRPDTAAAALGLGGDLCVDGSVGSRTACFREPYADGSSAALKLGPAEVAEHLRTCAAAGLAAGFHVIGDAALDAVLAALDAEAAAARPPDGTGRTRPAVRLEHVLAADDGQIAALVRHAVTVSAQPAFSTAFGGADGVYARRLGQDRARRVNRLGSLAAAGVPLVLGSDSPVTPFDPWAAVAAAVWHEDPDERLSARAAFAAHTRGAHRAAGTGGPAGGVLAPGAPATYAVWDVGELVVAVPDGRVRAWSTDPRSATPALPDLAPGMPRPRCTRTVTAGRVTYDRGDLG